MKSKALLTGDDPRTAMLTVEQVDRVTLEQAQAWYDSKLRNGPIEAAIVGVCLTTFCALLFPYALGLPLQLWPRFLIQ